MKNQNLENKQNSKSKILRDYDKEPIVIQDNANIYGAISLSIGTFVLAYIIFVENYIGMKIFLLCLLVFVGVGVVKELNSKAKVFLTNEYIEKRENNILVSRVYCCEIKRIVKTINSILPKSDFFVFKNKLAYFGFSLYFLFLVFTQDIIKILATITIAFGLIFLMLIPQFIIHYKEKAKNADWLYDVLFVKGKDGNFLNFMISNDKEYFELKEYFWTKFKINLDNAERKRTVLFEANKKDLKKSGEKQ